MTDLQTQMAEVGGLLRDGDLNSAYAKLDGILKSGASEPAALALMGMVSGKLHGPAEAISYFERLLKLMPQDIGTRVNLVNALVAMERFEEVLAHAPPHVRHPRLDRARAFALHQLGRLPEAEAEYAGIVAQTPEDFESWNNLGNVRSELEDVNGAIRAYEMAITHRRDHVEIYRNLLRLLTRHDRQNERLNVARDAVRIAPDDADMLVELALAHAVHRNFDDAEKAFGKALELDPKCSAAFVDLALLYENLNQIENFNAVVETAAEAGLGQDEVNYLKAWKLRREGDFAGAMALAEQVPDSIHPVRRLNLIAELAERLGQTDRAFAAFTAMNQASMAQRAEPEMASYRDMIAERAAEITAEQVARWKPVAPGPDAAAPIFIVGFPRSGTTLLDTLLMNIPSLCVLEEEPHFGMLDDMTRRERSLGDIDDACAADIRARYFDMVRTAHPDLGDRRIVDKNPLQMTRAAFVSRIFPNAKIILVERHPCDVVLSCFMANFKLNMAMRSFTDLVEAARTYATVFDSWTRAETLLNLDVHRLRYERLIEDTEGEMRKVLDFVGIEWDPSVTDNQSSAARRSHISTASYSQVTEPIYRRAVARWERYRAHLEPVLPILRPWAEKMGYAV